MVEKQIDCYSSIIFSRGVNIRVWLVYPDFLNLVLRENVKPDSS